MLRRYIGARSALVSVPLGNISFVVEREQRIVISGQSAGVFLYWVGKEEEERSNKFSVSIW